MSTRSKNVLFAGLTMLGSVLVVLLLAEVAIRLWGAGSDLQPDPYVIRSRVPNLRTKVFSVEPPSRAALSTSTLTEPIEIGWTSTNNLAFRMIEDVGEKAPDERRILLFGDSYLEALQVDAPDRFAEIVSRKLDDETRGRWKIINLGIVSGSPLQYLMQLHRWADELKPDRVIVFLGANDSPDDIRSRLRYGVVTDENGVPVYPEKQFSLALIRASHLARYFAQYSLMRLPNLFALLSPQRGTPVNAAGGNVDSWIELACAASEASKQAFLDGSGLYLRTLRDVTAEMGAGFAVVLVHYPFYFPDEPYHRDRWPADFLEALETHACLQSEGRAYEDFVRAFLRENQIEFASTYDRFMQAKRRNPEQKLWNFYDYHYNKVGHELAAEELHQLVRKMIDREAP